MKTFSLNELSVKAAFKPVGFTELKNIFEKSGNLCLSSGVIRRELRNAYNFTEGQASGTIRRAISKGLLISVGNSEYLYNVKYPELDSANDMDSSYTPDFDNTSDILRNSLPPFYDMTDFIAFAKANILSAVEAAGCAVNIFSTDDANIISFKEFLTCVKSFVSSDDIGNVDLSAIMACWSKVNDDTLRKDFAEHVKASANDVKSRINLLTIKKNEILWVYTAFSVLSMFVPNDEDEGTDSHYTSCDSAHENMESESTFC